MSNEIRVRFAPSPTGPFHIGGARSALFNWLFARKMGGKLVLRIEDTDLERSSRESEENIKAALKWLGLNWDEGIDVGGEYGPYRQTERLELYKKYTDQLLAEGKAYYCYCTDEELEAERQALSAKGQMPRYMGKCRNLTSEQIEQYKAEGRKPTVRFRVPADQQILVRDMVRGDVVFDSNGIGDFVIVKSDGIPTYNYAVVIDDALMKISHVIRGEDHISNTYKQILIFEALGFEVPKFGHLGMILAPDRSKLSKRHGATAVSDFVKQGYLTDALINFVALLGWSPSDGEEIKSVDEIAKDFRLNEISSSNSIFEYDKLKWMNSHYIKMLPMEELKERLKPYLTQYNLDELTDAQYTKMVEITREPLTLLSDITDAVPYFFGKDVHIDEETQTKTLDTEVSQNVLKDFVPKAQTWDWTDENLHEKLADFRAEWKEKGVKPKVTMWAIRAAITGRTCGADMVGILDILGKETSLYRAQKAIK